MLKLALLLHVPYETVYQYGKVCVCGIPV